MVYFSGRRLFLAEALHCRGKSIHAEVILNHTAIHRNVGLIRVAMLRLGVLKLLKTVGVLEAFRAALAGH